MHFAESNFRNAAYTEFFKGETFKRGATNRCPSS